VGVEIAVADKASINTKKGGTYKEERSLPEKGGVPYKEE